MAYAGNMNVTGMQERALALTGCADTTAVALRGSRNAVLQMRAKPAPVRITEPLAMPDESLVPDTALEQALRHLRTSQLATLSSQEALATGGDELDCTLTRAIRELRAAAAILQQYV
jgi:hypothetical protein